MSTKTNRKTVGRRSLHAVVRHDGDCSIYRYNSQICDCGELRKRIRSVRLTGDEPVWTAWLHHIAAIEKTSVPNDEAERLRDGNL